MAVANLEAADHQRTETLAGESPEPDANVRIEAFCTERTP
jgi:hypothetical protein